MMTLNIILSRLCTRPCSGALSQLMRKSHTYTPRRACLYVPGNDARKIQKIPGLDADCAILDCEDGVASNRKEEARSVIRKVLDEMTFGRTEPIVRINSIDSGLAEDDLKFIFAAEKLPPTLMVPKVENRHHIDWISTTLSAILSDRRLQDKIQLIIFVESAISLLNLKEIVQHGVEISEDTKTPIRLEGIVFGSDDFCADIGATRTSDAMELLYARQHVVTVAKAFSLQAIDLVHIDFKDLEGLRRQSLEGARMGFTGKQVIHPGQVKVVQESFTPSPEKVEWAQEVISAFNQHQSTGKGAFTFRGAMIDMPLLLQAKNIVRMVEATQRS